MYEALKFQENEMKMQTLKNKIALATNLLIICTFNDDFDFDDTYGKSAFTGMDH